jgi:hypothetical protein
VATDQLEDAPVGALPGFAAPEDDPQERLEVTDPAPETAEPPENHRPNLLDRFVLRSLRPATVGAATRTGTSSPGDPAPVRIGAKEAAIAVGGLVGVAAFAAAWVVQRRTRQERTVRQPTDGELDDIAAPLARLACRFIPAGALVPVITDGIMAASATGAYVTNGPLIVPNVRTAKEPSE